MSDVIQQPNSATNFRPRKNSRSRLDTSNASGGGGYCSSNIYQTMHRTDPVYEKEESVKAQIRSNRSPTYISPSREEDARGSGVDKNDFYRMQ